ncbi:hypothetical protein N7526_001854 [Penicillium atrosanguineum]|nr:hypothetical protein N7526_001854 [Penicillium atrosanguineum]
MRPFEAYIQDQKSVTGNLDVAEALSRSEERNQLQKGIRRHRLINGRHSRFVVRASDSEDTGQANFENDCRGQDGEQSELESSEKPGPAAALLAAQHVPEGAWSRLQK